MSKIIIISFNDIFLKQHMKSKSVKKKVKKAYFGVIKFCKQKVIEVDSNLQILKSRKLQIRIVHPRQSAAILDFTRNDNVEPKICKS